jgi:preprotein translocase subunit SecG
MLLSVNLFGQDSADFARSIGKMNVVIAVIITIFIGLIVFLIYMERRLSKIEKQIDSK